MGQQRCGAGAAPKNGQTSYCSASFGANGSGSKRAGTANLDASFLGQDFGAARGRAKSAEKCAAGESLQLRQKNSRQIQEDAWKVQNSHISGAHIGFEFAKRIRAQHKFFAYALRGVNGGGGERGVEFGGNVGGRVGSCLRINKIGGGSG